MLAALVGFSCSKDARGPREVEETTTDIVFRTLILHKLPFEADPAATDVSTHFKSQKTRLLREGFTTRNSFDGLNIPAGVALHFS